MLMIAWFGDGSNSSSTFGDPTKDRSSKYPINFEPFTFRDVWGKSWRWTHLCHDPFAGRLMALMVILWRSICWKSPKLVMMVSIFQHLSTSFNLFQPLWAMGWSIPNDSYRGIQWRFWHQGIGRQDAGDVPLAQDIQEAFSIFGVSQCLVKLGWVTLVNLSPYKVDGTKSGCQIIIIFLTKIAILWVPRCQTRLGPIWSFISDMTQMTGWFLGALGARTNPFLIIFPIDVAIKWAIAQLETNPNFAGHKLSEGAEHFGWWVFLIDPETVSSETSPETTCWHASIIPFP